MLYFAMLHLQAQPNLGTRRKKKEGKCKHTVQIRLWLYFSRHSATFDGDLRRKASIKSQAQEA